MGPNRPAWARCERKVLPVRNAQAALAAHPAGSPGTQASRAARVAGAGVVLLTVLTFGHCVTNDFAWDDTEYVLQNPAIQSLGNVPHLFGFRYWSQERPTPMGSYRPLREVSLAVDYALWRTAPGGYHLTSLAAHVAAVLCVYAVARWLMAGRVAAAAMAAAAFALHPSRVETLATVENRAEIFAAVLILISAACWARSVAVEGRGRWAWLSAAVAAFALALLAKSIAVVLPVVLALAAVCRPQARRHRRYAMASAGLMFVLAAGFVGVTAAGIEQEPFPRGPLGSMSLVWRPALAASTWHAYLGMTLWPVNGHADRLLPPPGPPLGMWYAVCAGWVGLLALCGWRLGRGARRGALGLAWYVAFLLPALNLWVIEGRPLAEQRLYIPLVGLCLLLGAGATRSRSGRACCAALLVVCSALSCRGTLTWADNRSLWFDNVLKAPLNARGRNNLGMQYSVVPAPTQAAAQLRAAFRLDPADYTAAENLAGLYRRQGLLDRSAQWLERALEIRPGRVEVWLDLAGVQCLRQRWPDAKRAFAKVLELDPERTAAYSGLAGVCAKLGQYAEAEHVLTRGLLREPSNAGLHANLGHVYQLTDRLDLALASCQSAVALEPTSPLAAVRLGTVLAALGRRAEAAAALRRALQLDPANREAREALHGLVMGAGREGGKTP